MNIKEEIQKIIEKNTGIIVADLSNPPKAEMGDWAWGCFALAKEQKKNPVEVAKELKEKISSVKPEFLEKVEAMGPYLNFFVDAKFLAKEILKAIADKKYGQSKLGKGKKIMVEYAEPNTHKAFHIGHLRNITTGESLCRIFENASYKVVRVNYQGDIGLHIAKCLWGIKQLSAEYEQAKNKNVEEKAKFLGQAYARGGQAYEVDEQAQKEIVAINEKIYSKDKEVYKIYKETRQWSLDYFETIYKRVGARFDRYYFESETFERGRKLILENLKKGIFKESDGAVIFEGEKVGLHNRVFLNNKGLPTYEAKDIALAELQLQEYKPDAIYHVVGKEQTDYFKVLFKALEQVFPKSIGKENHLIYGWVSLKEGKMSSRTGNVILGEWLLDEVKKKISEVMKDHEIKNRAVVEEKVAVAAVKYAFLRTGAQNDISFGIEESISLTGDSGPYLLYIVARIKSIFRKYGKKLGKLTISEKIEPSEKQLLNKLANFAEVGERAAEEKDPSKIAHYLLELAQDYNNFYSNCPVLKAEEQVVNFRLHLSKSVEKVMMCGLALLGIETVEEM